jgi:hypothetical protein
MTKTLVESRGAGSVKAPAADGSFEVVLIAPGQGSSGYYSEELIREYAPQAWPKGTHVYLDHLKEGETRSPERLLGALVEDTVIDPVTGEAKNRFKPLSKHREWVEEVREYVGLSISAQGDGHAGEVNGRNTLIVESLYPDIQNTVDIVSYAGRGGRFLESLLTEANQESTQVESSAGATKGNETMALEEKVDHLTSIVEGLVAKITASESADAQVAEVEEAVKAERGKVVEAAKAVADAELTESQRTALYSRIEAGDYDVTAALAEYKALREELVADLEAHALVEAGASASGGSNDNATYTVNGW